MKKILLAIGVFCVFFVLTWPVVYLINHPELMPTMPVRDVNGTGMSFTGNQEAAEEEAQAISTADITGNPAREPEVIVVTVITSTLEKRSHAGGGENLGYWQEGDTITARAVCRQGDDVWIQFDGGWSAARFAGRIFVSPSIEAAEVCDATK